ncbi:CG4554 [Drosophila busckii]|uniref:CG4554 n=1 Tax=Drosophila busckii TaxID=30019 RepID=A0A0M5IY51_DROBS|nr:small subunit processome component 20 homolog [Drosophila busckii]ALC42798.1 CG4554 [Drosophila busckii]
MSDLTEKSKGTNTFRFKSFTDRLNEIDLRHLALYHIGHKYEQLEEDDKETYFYQTLQKWNVLNLSEEYNTFSRECRNIVTLPQLLHQKDLVLDLLLERLSTATSLSQQPFLELLYVLARDLREEFYAYFQRVLDRLICLLNTQDAEQLEWTLVCLAHLFKTLKTYLKRNIGLVFNAILPLLDEHHYAVHVTNFAVECFAYIARDVHDFPRFLVYVLQTILREQVDSVHGCGRLLYEMLRGLNAQLHTTAAVHLAHLFEVVSNVDSSWTFAQTSLLVEILKNCLRLLLNFLRPDQSSIIWQQLCAALSTESLNDSAINNLLNLMLLLIDHKEGLFVAEMPLLVRTLLKLLDKYVVSGKSPLQQLSVVVSSLLNARQAQLTHLNASCLLKKQLNIVEVSLPVYEEFVLQLLDYRQFELMVLPHIVSYYEEHQDTNGLEILARIIQKKRPLYVDATSLTSWEPYPIQLKNGKTLETVEQQLKHINLTEEKQLLLLLLLPHFRGINKQSVESSLQLAIKNHLMELNSTPSPDCTLLLLLLQTHYVLKFKLESELRAEMQQQLLPLIGNDLHTLACLQISFLQASKDELSTKTMDLTLNTLSWFLGQPQSQGRRIAAHCLELIFAGAGKCNPYSHFTAACSVEPSVHNYRELLLQLQKLEPAGVQFKQFNKLPYYKEHVVNLLLGLLYNNFKFVWAPIQQLLAEYSKCMTPDKFWKIFMLKLHHVVGYINYKSEGIAFQLPAKRKFNSEALSSLLHIDEPQHQLSVQQALNYRQLLWQSIPKFGNLVELRNADLVRLFLQFVEHEYRLQLERTEYVWNLKESSALVTIDEEDDNNDDNQNEMTSATQNGHNIATNDRIKCKTRNIYTKVILQTLQLKLACFVAQPNPKAIYKQTEMHAFYLELLSGPNPQLQQLALNCLVAYNQPAALVHYKQLLSGIIDEGKFKATLSSFELDALEPQQRTDLMPFILRVLYSHLTKGGVRQLSAQQRKALILRFLGRLEEVEILNFLQMAFGRYTEYTNLPINELDTHVRAQITLDSVIAARQLQRMINLIELIRKEFACRLSTSFQVYILKLLLLAGSVSQYVITTSSTESIYHGYKTAYKKVRHTALQTLVNYFGQLIDISDLWQAHQLQAICEVFVWPGLALMPLESIHTPTPLLKLLLLWSNEPRYQFLLQKSQTPESPSIIHYLMALLFNDKAKPAVRRSLLQLVEHLLECAKGPEEHSEDARTMLQPYIFGVLQLLQASWRQKRSGKLRALDKRELNILALLTVHVQEADTCELLLQVLLPIIKKQIADNASAETVVQLITTLANLCKRITTPHAYVQQLAVFFEIVNVLPARKQLCEILVDMAKKLRKQCKQQNELTSTAEELRQTARIVMQLNALDKRWIEQPDYSKRLQALSETKQLLVEGFNIQLGLLVTYNCFYMLRHDSDLGLRVNVGELLKLLLPQLTLQLSKEELIFWLDDCILPIIQRCIRDERNEHARNEAIGLLGELARQCPHSHEVFRDLAPLTDSSDLEVDFFENMIHLQTQRHGRALQRLVNIAKGACWRKNTPCTRTLTQFVMPLATRYLLNEKYISKHTLVDAAIEAVGGLCELLPWQQYHAVLRHYLQKMRLAHDHQKQCVRLVVRILDGFHFDLSLAHADTALAQPTENAGALKNEDSEKIENTAIMVQVASDCEHIVFDVENHENLDDNEQSMATQRPLIIQQQLDHQLTSNAARRVMTTITSILLPTLNRSITEKTNYDSKHKINRRRLGYEREEDEIQRVPIALAMVKLLQKLPHDLLESSLPGIFMKVCTFLRSPLKSVRMLTRDILKKIILTLGGSYLALLLEQLQSLLTRGFQVHVLSVTLHGVLDVLRSQLEPVHIECCLHNLLDVVLNDIFGEASVEKEVDKIVAHTPEAKPSAKSYLTLQVATRHIRDNCLLDLLLPFKELLSRTQSRKTTQKIQECFLKIVAGLVENPHIAPDSLVIFIYGTMSESITDLLPGKQKSELPDNHPDLIRRVRPDCLLLSPAPGRRSVSRVNKQVKTNAQANAHILIEFGLELLHFLLKRKRLSEIDYQPFLHPLLPLLRDCLNSSHAQTTTYALKCYASIWIGNYELSELQADHLSSVVTRMFDILKNFSTFGATRQEENAQLVRASFKAVVALLRKCSNYILSTEQIEQLLLHIEQELQEGDCSSQSFCFTLLKALVWRKVDSRSLHDLMKRLTNLCIQSQSDYVREESRTILLTYIMEYPLQKRIDQILKFMSVQLAYSQTSGRLSAIQFMQMIINQFPLQLLTKHSEFLYLSLGSRLVNDEDTLCRRAVAHALEAMIAKLKKIQRQPLLDLTLLLLTSPQSSKKPGVCEMASALLSRFVQAEGTGFADRLKLVFPILVDFLTLGDPDVGGKFVRAPGHDAQFTGKSFVSKKPFKIRRQTLHSEESENLLLADFDIQEIEQHQCSADHQLIQLQYCLINIFEHCGEIIVTNEELAPITDNLAYASQRLLGHEHNWVRCNAAKLLVHILAHYDYEYVGQQLVGIKQEHNDLKPLQFIYAQPDHDIKSLVLDMCAQVTPGDTAKEMIDELTKFLLYVAHMLRNLPFVSKNDKKMNEKKIKGPENQEQYVSKLNLNWLMRNICNLINKEMSKAQHDTTVRTALFTLIEGLIPLLSIDTLSSLLPTLLKVLVREMSEEDRNVDGDLRQLALRVGSRLRKRIGVEVYDEMRNVAQTNLIIRRAERRKIIVQERVQNPLRAAKRKASIQERKKTAKRLKTAVVRGNVLDFKHKLKRKRKNEIKDI